MKRLCRMLCLACAVLLLLPACRTRPTDTPTADTRTQDEILEELFAQTDGPVIVQLIGRSPYLFQDELALIWNAPHVINVIGTSYVHWLNDSEDASLTMIGQYDVDLDPAAVVEGRWYETDTECCVNRAEYERLLADPESGFTGIGDTVTYSEPEMQQRPGARIGSVKIPPAIVKQYTMVGIVEDCAPYDNTEAYAIHHMYTTVGGVTAMMANYTNNNLVYRSNIDGRAYWNARITKKQNGPVVYKEDPEHEGKALFRCADERIYTEDEWREQYLDTVCNAGYTVEVTLDSGKNYADFVEFMRLTQFKEEPVRELLNMLEEMRKESYKVYEEQLKPAVDPRDGTLIEKTEEQKAKVEAWLVENLSNLEPDATTAYLQEIGELDEWFRCNGNTPYVLHPLRVEE